MVSLTPVFFIKERKEALCEELGELIHILVNRMEGEQEGKGIGSLMNSSKPYWGIAGYSVPRTLNYLNKSAVISPERLSRPRKLFLNPDPSKYSPSLKKTQELYWTPRNGKFASSKKVNYVEERINRSINNPGPGSYFKERNESQLSKTLGRFE